MKTQQGRCSCGLTTSLGLGCLCPLPSLTKLLWFSAVSLLFPCCPVDAPLAPQPVSLGPGCDAICGAPFPPACFCATNQQCQLSVSNDVAGRWQGFFSCSHRSEESWKACSNRLEFCWKISNRSQVSAVLLQKNRCHAPHSLIQKVWLGPMLVRPPWPVCLDHSEAGTSHNSSVHVQGRGENPSLLIRSPVISRETLTQKRL